MLNTQIIKGSHIEIFSNKTLILEECYGMVDYRENYIKLKLKKGFINLLGTNFLISEFDNNRIVINGNISSLEFCV